MIYFLRSQRTGRIKIGRMIAHQAKEVAESRKIRLSDYLSGLLRQAVDDDYEKIR